MENAITTLLPLVFLVQLLVSEAIFKHRGIDIDGTPPINPKLFFLSKYSVLPVWASMALQSWGFGFQIGDNLIFVRWLSLGLWCAGFALLFLGRLILGNDIRLGSPNEPTTLRTNGLYQFSRHPMYLGLNATIVASIFYTLNPLILALGLFIITVHHYITLAEERWLLGEFGQEYAQYCDRVRRYL